MIGIDAGGNCGLYLGFRLQAVGGKSGQERAKVESWATERGEFDDPRGKYSFRFLEGNRCLPPARRSHGTSMGEGAGAPRAPRAGGRTRRGLRLLR